MLRPLRPLLATAIAATVLVLARPGAAQQPEGEGPGAAPAPTPPPALPPGLTPPPSPGVAPPPVVVVPPGIAAPARSMPAERPGIALLPDYPNFGSTRAPTPKVRANPTMMTAGILMTSGGLLLVIAGAVITASSIDVVDIYCDGPAVCLRRDDVVKKGIGSVMLGGGAVIGAIGFPLWLFGGRMVPVNGAPAKTGFFSPDLKVGVGNAKVSFSF